MSSLDWQKLGKEVVARRVELGFNTREKFAHAAEISSRLLGDLENGKRDSYDRATLVKLERACRWGYGSVDATLGGATPTPLPEGSTRAGKSGRPAIHIDPAVRFGRPQIRGVPTEAIADPYFAGESAATVCDDYGITRHEFLVALWHEATSGDYVQNPAWKRWADEVAYPALAGWKELDVATLPLPPCRLDREGPE